MKLRVTAEIKGLLFLSEAPEPLELADGVVYGFKCDSSRRMTHVAVSVAMNADQVARMRNVMTPAPGRAPSLEISGIDDVVAILEQRLRWLEGRLSFGPQGDALHSINVWECEFEFLPETPDEQAVTAVTSFQVTEHERLPEPTRLTVEELKEMVRQLDGYDDELAILQGRIGNISGLPKLTERSFSDPSQAQAPHTAACRGAPTGKAGCEGGAALDRESLERRLCT